MDTVTTLGMSLCMVTEATTITASGMPLVTTLLDPSGNTRGPSDHSDSTPISTTTSSHFACVVILISAVDISGNVLLCTKNGGELHKM